MKNKENTQEGVFIRHESCEACGSRDNKAVYDNGDKMTYFCFGCEDTGIYMEKGQDLKSTPKEFHVSMETIDDIKDYPIRGFRERKIKKEIAAEFYKHILVRKWFKKLKVSVYYEAVLFHF